MEWKEAIDELMKHFEKRAEINREEERIARERRDLNVAHVCGAYADAYKEIAAQLGDLFAAAMVRECLSIETVPASESKLDAPAQRSEAGS